VELILPVHAKLIWSGTVQLGRFGATSLAIAMWLVRDFVRG
jgi:hypothetical protein